MLAGPTLATTCVCVFWALQSSPACGSMPGDDLLGPFFSDALDAMCFLAVCSPAAASVSGLPKLRNRVRPDIFSLRHLQASCAKALGIPQHPKRNIDINTYWCTLRHQHRPLVHLLPRMPRPSGSKRHAQSVPVSCIVPSIASPQLRNSCLPACPHLRIKVLSARILPLRAQGLLSCATGSRASVLQLPPNRFVFFPCLFVTPDGCKPLINLYASHLAFTMQSTCLAL